MRHMRQGQAMFLSVMVIGGALLTATTIAGLFMAYQIRQVGDFANSAKAIFAADAGIEAVLYNLFCDRADPDNRESPPCPLESPPGVAPIACPDGSGYPNCSRFANGARLIMKCYNPGFTQFFECFGPETIRAGGRADRYDPSSLPAPQLIKFVESQGSAANSYRSFSQTL